MLVLHIYMEYVPDAFLPSKKEDVGVGASQEKYSLADNFSYFFEIISVMH